ncbi:hypothetical protein OG331_46850 [Streptomyces sp. NBC_01017]|uniref:hypothetical protein n=1 Tax=Streptomyces sp. NBC_01017 TaxID=2903721 RepID=UPI00386FA27F|nr:hypothetical protein OG331_46850 [Streptomyces sp. NBC_01017]
MSTASATSVEIGSPVNKDRAGSAAHESLAVGADAAFALRGEPGHHAHAFVGTAAVLGLGRATSGRVT